MHHVTNMQTSSSYKLHPRVSHALVINVSLLELVLTTRFCALALL